MDALIVGPEPPLRETQTSTLGNNQENNSARRAAQEFTSLIFLEVLKAMRSAMRDESAETDSLSRDIYTSMMDTEIARLMAKQDTTGITKFVEKALNKISGGVQSPPTSNSNSKTGDDRTTANAPSLAPETSIARVPVEGVITSRFGLRTDPIDRSIKHHYGMDFAARAGTPIMAVDAGKVTFSGPAHGYGNLVEILHRDGLTTRYAHNEKNLVRTGDEIKPGQKIATVGNVGRSTGAHLHFEVRRYGQPVDPQTLLGGIIDAKS